MGHLFCVLYAIYVRRVDIICPLLLPPLVRGGGFCVAPPALPPLVRGGGFCVAKDGGVANDITAKF